MSNTAPDPVEEAAEVTASKAANIVVAEGADRSDPTRPAHHLPLHPTFIPTKSKFFVRLFAICLLENRTSIFDQLNSRFQIQFGEPVQEQELIARSKLQKFEVFVEALQIA